MRLILLTFLLLLVTASTYAVDALVVTKDGTSIVAYKVSRKGEKLYYSTADGSHKSVEVSQLYQILPKVIRGHKYDPPTVAKYIKYANKAKAKFPKLRKQLQVVLDEWLAVRRQFKELTPAAQARMKQKIEEIFAAYEHSPKTGNDFGELRGKLEMIRYQDLQGVFDGVIDARLDAISKVFIEATYNTLKERCNRTKITAKEFLETMNLATQHRSYRPSKEQLTDIATLLPKARKACLTTELSDAKGVFHRGPTIDNYLEANTTLSTLLNQIARPDDKPAIERLRRQMQVALKGYDFGTGFPLTGSDIRLLGKVGTYSSTTAPEADPAAIIFASKRITDINLRQKQNLKLCAIFRRRPPKGTLGLLIYPYELIIWSSSARLKNARVAFNFSTDAVRGKPVRTEDGSMPTTIAFAVVAGDPRNIDADVTTLSNYIPFRLTR